MQRFVIGNYKIILILLHRLKKKVIKLLIIYVSVY